MNNENPVPVDGLETPESSESAEKMETGEQSRAGSSSGWFLPLIYGTVFGVSMAMMMPKLWYMWLPVGWGMGLAIGTSLKSREDSKPSEVAESE